MIKPHVLAAMAAALSLGSGLPALAQEAPPPPPAAPAGMPAMLPDEADCGSWTNGQWQPNGSCAGTDYRGHVSGTIVAVKGHLVTLQQTSQQLVINDQPALDHRKTGRVAVGRIVTAFGVWRNGTFYAGRLV
jgi:hypothetical protein